jgi:hypothetical protein
MGSALISVSYIVEMPEEDKDKFEGRLVDKIGGELSQDKLLSIENLDVLLKWNSTSSIGLDSGEYNCGKCSKCGHWTTDSEKPYAVQGLCNGATVDGELLCDECLPPDHRWAF